MRRKKMRIFCKIEKNILIFTDLYICGQRTWIFNVGSNSPVEGLL